MGNFKPIINYLSILNYCDQMPHSFLAFRYCTNNNLDIVTIITKIVT